MYKKEDVELICKNLTVYRCKFISRQNNNSSWVTNPKLLKDEDFSEAIYYPTYALKGLFNAYNTKFFAIDIDGHNGESFDHLKFIYNNVINILGYPSFVSKSPNGLHAYYLLSDYCNSSILIAGVKNLLDQNNLTKNLEVKPTPNVALRLPNYNYILSKELDYFINIEKFEFGNFLEKCIHYPSFNFIQSQEKIVSKKTTFIEEDTIKKGHTNDALNHYIPLWKGYGYSIDQVVSMFYSKLDYSYQGELRNIDKLKKRILYYYKEDKSYSYEAFKKDETNYELKYPHIYEAVINTYLTYADTNDHNKQLRIKSLKEDLTTILKIYDNNNLLKENKEQLELHSYKNPFYKHELSRGCYPIPSKSIKRNNLLFFIDLGLLSLPYGKHYSISMNSCIYYYINIKFITEFNYSRIHHVIELNISSNMIRYRNKEDGIFAVENSNGPPYQLYINDIFGGNKMKNTLKKKLAG